MRTRRLALLSLFLAMCGVTWGVVADDKKPAEPPAVKKEEAKKEDAKSAKPKIQLAILLDTSGSMQGLINQARTQLWQIVNELAKAKKGEASSDLTVALYEYGKSSLNGQEGFIRLIVPLTDDLDKISNELFALTTNGGEEYCGWVIERATTELAWSKSTDDLKLIYVAGNEPFTQGQVDPYKACEEAIKKGITVNTIFCGNLNEGINTGWQKGAQLADGSFISIDQNKAVAAVTAPQDGELAKLSQQLNGTYVFFGTAERRKEREALQEKQDKLAASAAPGAGAQRALAKGNKEVYRNADYDLVDALDEKKVKLEEVKDEDLPEAIRGKTLAEKKAYVEEKRKERSLIQEQIKRLGEEREKYIVDARKKAAEQGAETLDTAVIRSVREQATKKKYEFQGEKKEKQEKK
ncbi:MAG: VWA domain-containing protein [Planctomycetia bacterium]|nr:VWA domain-containing protein [Planctomycetia bacterium]